MDITVNCDVESTFPIIAIVISSIGVLVIGYHVYNKITQLRIIFWIICMSTTLVSIINLIWLYVGCVSEPIIYHLIYLIFSMIYLILVVWCFLDLGKKFYPTNKWKTPLYNITIIGCVLYTIVIITQITLLILNSDEIKYSRAPHGMSYITVLISLTLGAILIACSFLYTFKPIIRLQIRFNNSTNSHDSPSINPQNIIVGWWYMTTSGLIAISYFIFCILNTTKGPRIFYDPLSNSIDYIHRTLFILDVSMPPPKCFLNFVKSKFLPRDLFIIPNSSVNSFEDFVLENTTTNPDNTNSNIVFNNHGDV